MHTTSDVLFRKLCYMLHRSFVEMRKLAQLKLHQQQFDLADAFEQLPGLLSDWTEQDAEVLRASIESYQVRYSGQTFDYLSIWDMDEADFLETLSRW